LFWFRLGGETKQLDATYNFILRFPQARVSPNSDFRNLPFGPKPVLRIDSIEESHENRKLFIGVLSLGKIFGDRHQWLGWSKSDLAGTCLVPAPIRAAIPKKRPDAR